MPLWTKDTPPKAFEKIGKKAVATNRGWEDSSTKEVIAAIRGLPVKAGAGDILSVSFGEASYLPGAALSVVVRLNEKVNVTAGAAIVLSFDGVGGDVSAYAAAQDGVSEIIFNKTVGGDPLVAPSVQGVLSIAAQSLTGTIKDADSAALDINPAISAAQALAAGTRSISAPAQILSVNFDELSYAQGDALGVVVLFNEAVDVPAESSIVLSWSGVSGNITAYAAEQLDTETVLFDKDAAGDPLVVPLEEGTLSIAAQTLVGEIIDADESGAASNTEVTAAVALAAGDVVVPA